MPSVRIQKSIGKDNEFILIYSSMGLAVKYIHAFVVRKPLLDGTFSSIILNQEKLSKRANRRNKNVSKKRYP